MEPKSTWAVQDATKIQAFMRCPRSYFYEYVLGWRQDVTKVDIVFGSAWHKAMEVLLIQGYDLSSIAEAQIEFEKVYNAGVTQEMEFYSVKNPSNALRALEAYCRRYARDRDRWELLKTEIAGSVFLGIDNLHFKIDAVVKDKENGTVYALEHKTTTNFSPQWMNQWRQKMQIGVYLYVLHVLYGDQGVGGIIINGVAITNPPKLKLDGSPRAGARDNDFLRLTCNWSVAKLEEWLETVSFYYEWILQEFSNLERCSSEDSCLHAFPKNVEACNLYWGCPYLDFCSAIRNPLSVNYLPAGFKEEHWDPREREAKERVEISFTELKDGAISATKDTFELSSETEAYEGSH